MSRYTIEFIPLARRQFKKLPQEAKIRLAKLIENLADNPRPHGYKRLHGKLKEFFRMDTGNYRIVYEIKDDILIILVVKIGDRRDIYRDLNF